MIGLRTQRSSPPTEGLEDVTAFSGPSKTSSAREMNADKGGVSGTEERRNVEARKDEGVCTLSQGFQCAGKITELESEELLKLDSKNEGSGDVLTFSGPSETILVKEITSDESDVLRTDEISCVESVGGSERAEGVGIKHLQVSNVGTGAAIAAPWLSETIPSKKIDVDSSDVFRNVEVSCVESVGEGDRAHTDPLTVSDEDLEDVTMSSGLSKSRQAKVNVSTNLGVSTMTGFAKLDNAPFLTKLVPLLLDNAILCSAITAPGCEEGVAEHSEDVRAYIEQAANVFAALCEGEAMEDGSDFYSEIDLERVRLLRGQQAKTKKKARSSTKKVDADSRDVFSIDEKYCVVNFGEGVTTSSGFSETISEKKINTDSSNASHTDEIYRSDNAGKSEHVKRVGVYPITISNEGRGDVTMSSGLSEMILVEQISADGSEHFNACLQNFGNTAEPKTKKCYKTKRRSLFKKQLRTCRLVFVALILLSLLGHVNADAPASSHGWDFRNCVTGQDVLDTGEDGGKTASPVNGPTCSASGISLDGNDDYVNINESWEWGGTTSFEVYVKYNSFNSWSLWHGVELQQSDVTDLAAARCFAGEFFSISSGCSQCPLGSYSESSGAASCTSCPTGKTSFTTGATSVSDCVPTVHSWNFMGCSDDSPVVDETVGSALAATAFNGASCSAGGMVFDEVDDYVDLDDWEWGGTTSIEVYVKYDSFNDHSRVFDFSNGANSDNVFLNNVGSASTIGWGVYQGSTQKYLRESNWDSSTWTHVVVTVSGTTMKVYKNGALAGTKTDGHEPNILTRTNHIIGNRAENDLAFDGTIAYLKIYHNKELTDSEVSSLQNSIPCYAGTYGAGLPDCTPCPFGTYTSSPGSSACTECPTGKTSFTSGATSDSVCVHDSTHEWNFMGCSDESPTVDETDGSSLKATAKNGATCSTEGMVFDGVNDWVDIDDWEWGGTTSIEVYVKYDSFNYYSRVFDFSNGANSDNVNLHNNGSGNGAGSTIIWNIWKGSAQKYLAASNFDSSIWTHVVATISGTTMKVYKNGVLAGTNTDGWEPNVLTRSQHWLGRSPSSSGYVDGTIAKLKIWHNKELSLEEINALPKMPCLPGTFGSGYPDCEVCPAGAYSSSTASSSCTTCPIGTYLSDDGLTASEHDHVEDCAVCEAGKYNDDAATDSNHHISCSVCPDGTYNADTGTSAASHVACTNCPAGKKNDKTGATNHNGADDCDLCSPGTYAANPGAATCATCPEGESSGSGSTNCGECPAGYVCTSDGRQEPCPSGKYSSGSSACLPCPPGHKCPGATDKISCDAATYQQSEGQAKCKICGAGKYQPDEGQNSCQTCPAGYFCPRASSTALPCGSSALYCPESSSSVTPVAQGHYTLPASDESTTTRSAQQICPSGHVCSGGTKRLCNDEGEYSDETGLSTCKTAPPGYMPTDNRESTVKCLQGSASLGGADICAPCEGEGEYADEVGLSTCKIAPPGYTPTDNRETIIMCSKGFASLGGSDSCTPCEGEGEYADEAGLSTCKIAPAGKRPTPNRMSVENCAEGTYSLGGNTDCVACELGKFSNEGAVGCSQCEPGEVPVGNVCEKCEVGKYSKFGSSACLSCEDGFYSPDPGSSTCFTCTPGKFTNADQTECIFCPAGKISGVAASTCSVCEKGKYAEGTGNTECQFCDDDKMLVGSITLQNGTTTASGCICPAGEYVHFKENICQSVPDGVETTIQAMTFT
ncbi:hypothetical protein TrST_g13124 [Triparma strigata]|uniref:Tyrosine-protein kinase ephrin type A/B receptor-like domain-containing protein n=1 Tax=Triparma strigata TaxID=1606541 RepID=A0A9W7B4P5_9STRA|nr:hypothetical protein TrST_g13124 [Triparma strigata]